MTIKAINVRNQFQLLDRAGGDDGGELLHTP